MPKDCEGLVGEEEHSSHFPFVPVEILSDAGEDQRQHDVDGPFLGSG